MHYSIMKGEDRKQRSNGQENWNRATEKGKLGQLIGVRRMEDREQITLDRVTEDKMMTI
jgi:hypothetical protein